MKKLQLLFFFTIIPFLVVTAQTGNNAEQIAAFFDQWKNDPAFRNASVGISVLDADSGKTIMETVPQVSMTPASIQKIVTSAAALEILGPQYRFETRIEYSGGLDSISGILNGNLIIKGGGDPALGSVYFKEHYLNNHFIDQWVEAIQQKGIKKISGDLVADASVYEEQMIPNTWVWEDLGNYYGAGACGLSIYDNMYEIWLKSGNAGTPAEIIKTMPEVPGLEIENEVTASSVGGDQTAVFGSPFDSKRIIRGTIPANRDVYKIKASLPDPPLLLACQLKQKLEENNIQLDGTVKTTYKSCETGNVICKTMSPSLSEIITVMNHESVNLFAEHLCKHLAYIKTGHGSTGTGIEIIRKFWENKGIDTKGMFMTDGSGLSRFNAITPRHITAILNYIDHSSGAEVFKQSLPTAGGAGTLHVFSEEKFPDGMLRAKSGSMTRVRCYAGFLKTKSEKELIFAIMLNNFSCSQPEAIKKIENFLVELSNN